jgi:hypothetical protein
MLVLKIETKEGGVHLLCQENVRRFLRVPLIFFKTYLKRVMQKKYLIKIGLIILQKKEQYHKCISVKSLITLSISKVNQKRAPQPFKRIIKVTGFHI